MATHNTRDPETWPEPPPGTTSDPVTPPEAPTDARKDDSDPDADKTRRPRPEHPIVEPDRPEPKPDPRRR